MEFGTRSFGSIFVLFLGLCLKVTVVVASVCLLVGTFPGVRALGYSDLCPLARLEAANHMLVESC
jgi:hypothetical protein